MARWKNGPQGAYYDPNDDGPDQVKPPQGVQPPQAQATQNAVAGGQYNAPRGGVTGQATGTVDPSEEEAAQGRLGSPRATAVQQAVSPRDQIQSYYQQYLGRQGSDQEINSHIANPHGVGGAEVAIRGSAEAAARGGMAAPTADPNLQQAEQIKAHYRQYLGREASDADVRAHLQNPGGMNGALTAIRGSAEAAQRQAQSAASTPPPAQRANPTSWNTDGFAGPAYTAQNANQQAMAGWDQTKWGNQDHQTPKYAVGRILSQYAFNDPAQRSAAVAEIQKAYPGATFNGKDILTIPGVGSFDILKGAGNGGEAWQWNQVSDANGKAVGGPAPGGAPGLNGFNPAAPQMNQFNQQWLQDFLKQMGVGL